MIEVEAYHNTLRRELDKIWEAEPDGLRRLRLGLLNHRPGSYGGLFSAIDHANGMIRDFAGTTMVPILRAAYSDTFDLEQLRALVKLMHFGYTDYLRYSGYVELFALDDGFRSILDLLETKEQFIEVYTDLLKYANKTAAWAYHYMPWEFCAVMRYRPARDVEDASRLSSTV